MVDQSQTLTHAVSLLHQAVGKGAAPEVAEGLGGVNIEGVDDQKAHTDVEHEEGRPSELCTYTPSEPSCSL